MSSIEYLLNALKTGEDVSGFMPQSRQEEILKRICLKESLDDLTPLSRVEVLLIEAAENVAGSGCEVKIPSVSNLSVSKYGILTFDEPDVSELVDYNPTISYSVTVNGVAKDFSTNNCDIFKLLKEGENTIIVIVKARLMYKDKGIAESIEYSIPAYTNISDFTLETATVDGVSCYKITAYNGSETEINIPPTNTDGLPILELNSINVSKIRGEEIKRISSFKDNATITEIDFSNTTENNDMTMYFYNCPNLTKVLALNTSNVTRIGSMFAGCIKLTEVSTFDTSKVKDAQSIFSSCEILTKTPALNLSNASTISNCFYRCFKLKTILTYGMKTTFNISDSTKFEASDLVTILSNCQVVTSSVTLTMGSTNLAKLDGVYVKETGVEPYEGITVRPCVICESTDEGAMLATDYFSLIKGWNIQ